jgi:hypothetical protein
MLGKAMVNASLVEEDCDSLHPPAFGGEPLAYFRVPRSPSSRLTVGMTAIPTTIFHSNPYNHPPQMREDEFGLQLQRMQD